MNKIFIIAPQFPPSFSPPAQRARLLVKHLFAFEFEPIVFTVDKKFREEKNDDWILSLAGDNYLLENVSCISQNLTRKFNFGDLGLRMLPYLPWKIIKAKRKYRPKFILYLVPPWYILIAAPIIKFFTGIPYGIDFIDPWVYNNNVKLSNNFKRYISQKIAHIFEGWVCKYSSLIFSVSQGINDNLLIRHPYLNKNNMHAIPYGAEISDFKDNLLVLHSTSQRTIRYIGAIWEDCYPVLDGLMPALKLLSKNHHINIEFIGTNYANGNRAKSQLNRWVTQNNLSDYFMEFPERVNYKEAIHLTMSSSLLLLIGGMQPYYAASKLMGLIASKKKFVAFVHRDSFPAQVLLEVNYPYFVTYTSELGDMPIDKIDILLNVLESALMDNRNVNLIDAEHPAIKKNSAFGMTKSFIEPIKKII